MELLNRRTRWSSLLGEPRGVWVLSALYSVNWEGQAVTSLYLLVGVEPVSSLHWDSDSKHGDWRASKVRYWYAVLPILLSTTDSGCI